LVATVLAESVASVALPISILPFTSSFAWGLVVPIPTLPGTPEYWSFPTITQSPSLPVGPEER
jgi:hypothetical protein